MRRRGLTVLIGTVLVALLTASLLWVTVPYVVLGPGPTVNTLGDYKGAPIIAINGEPSYDPKGQLRLVTVAVSPDINVVDAIYSWFDSTTAVVPKDLVYPPQQTQQQVDNQNLQEFQMSQSSAETAALTELGYPVLASVQAVTAGKPAEGHLLPGDIITAINGVAIASVADVTTAIHAKPVGTVFTIDYTRAGAKGSTSIASVADNTGQPVIGISLQAVQPHPFTITVKLGDIGGPSAGLMFTLGILAKLTSTDITGGLDIAGTGTIDDNGAVGPIGGIAQKLVGAKRDGAKYFFTPAANCAEALDNAVPGLPLVKVTDLNDALNALTALREHREPVQCSVGK